jgi:formylglycine-generating enzyme required for sulfatase activity
MPYSFTVNCAGLCAALAIAFVMFALPFALRADSIDMVYVASGKVLVGDDSNLDDEKPTHFVSTSDYFIDVYEVNIWHWEKVATWAEANGYQFSDFVKQRKDGPWWYQNGSNLLFPMNMADWYDAVKWCNARSELEGRIPVYYEDANKTIVYRSGSIDLNETNVKWNGSGYRLPTEVEWEKAARGEASTAKQAYSWGNSFLNGSLANYYLSGDPLDNASTPVGYFDGRQDINATENSRGGETTNHKDMANGFGLYDITGNVSEWCWDWYDAEWYSNLESMNRDTKGPTVGQLYDARPRRVSRGGHYNSYSEGDRAGGNSLRIAYRGAHLPGFPSRMRGLRCVRANIEDSLWTTAIAWMHFPNWYFLDWFGYYYQSEYTWVYHGDFGWIYPNGKGSYDNWIYFPQHGWVWTNRYSFPYFFSSVDSKWYEYDLTGAELGWFERFSDKARFRWGRFFPR